MKSGLIFILFWLYTSSCFAINFTTSTLEESLLRANIENKKIFVFYSANWCIPCVIMKETVFTDGKISEIVESEAIAVLVDYDESQPSAWTKNYDVKCLPTSMVLDSKGNVVSKYEGGMGAQKFMSFFRNEIVVDQTVANNNVSDFIDSQNSKNHVEENLLSENMNLEGKIYLDGKLVDASSGSSSVKSENVFTNKRSNIKKTSTASESIYKYVIQFGAFNSLEEVKSQQELIQTKIDIETMIYVDPDAESYQYKLISKNRYNSRQVNEVVKGVKSKGQDCFPKTL